MYTDNQNCHSRFFLNKFFLLEAFCHIKELKESNNRELLGYYPVLFSSIINHEIRGIFFLILTNENRFARENCFSESFKKWLPPNTKWFQNVYQIHVTTWAVTLRDSRMSKMLRTLVLTYAHTLSLSLCVSLSPSMPPSPPPLIFQAIHLCIHSMK